VTDKIDRLSELRIDRTDAPRASRRWPYIVAGIAVAAAVVFFVVQRILDAPVGALLMQGLVAAVIIGLLGGLFPAIRAVRIPVTTALREM
jgi:uncharacterized membrane protein YraQ (UPF0718 family)